MSLIAVFKYLKEPLSWAGRGLKAERVDVQIIRALLLKKTGPPSNPLKTVNGK